MNEIFEKMRMAIMDGKIEEAVHIAMSALGRSAHCKSLMRA